MDYKHALKKIVILFCIMVFIISTPSASVC